MKGEPMRILIMPVSAVLAAALIAGIAASEKPADDKTNESGTSDDAQPIRKGEEMNDDAKGKYATVNGLKMYYEIHGIGRPLVVLHGAFGLATVYPGLAKDRQVIAVEL